MLFKILSSVVYYRMILEELHTPTTANRTCRTCLHWTDTEEHPGGFHIGVCDAAPFDSREMKVDDMAFGGCGHDGSIVTGEGYYCRKYIAITG